MAKQGVPYDNFKGRKNCPEGCKLSFHFTEKMKFHLRTFHSMDEKNAKEIVDTLLEGAPKHPYQLPEEESGEEESLEMAAASPVGSPADVPLTVADADAAIDKQIGSMMGLSPVGNWDMNVDSGDGEDNGPEVEVDKEEKEKGEEIIEVDKEEEE